jgi:hypothetical protein
MILLKTKIAHFFVGHARWFARGIVCVLLLALYGCPPPAQQDIERKGEFVAGSNKIFDRGDGFDIRDTITYPETKSEGLTEARLDITDRALTMARCTWCHECGFNQMFDVQAFGTPRWKPIYTGEDWFPIVTRMRRMENSLLNEVIAERIFNFLRDSTTGKYDESKDQRGGSIRKTPSAPPATPVQNVSPPRHMPSAG